MAGLADGLSVFGKKQASLPGPPGATISKEGRHFLEGGYWGGGEAFEAGEEEGLAGGAGGLFGELVDFGLPVFLLQE